MLASRWLVAWRTRHLVAVSLLAGVILAALALVASHADPSAADLAATLWLQQFRQPAFAALMAAVSWFGYAPQSWLMPLALAAPFLLRRLWIEAIWAVGAAVSALPTAGLKQLVHRPRPSPELVNVASPLSDPSFPSGHVVQYTTAFGVTFFLLYVLAPRSVWRTAGLILLALPIALVGPSRLYLGQHWLSDVLGGYAVAVLLLVPYCWAYASLRLVDSPTPTGETTRYEEENRSRPYGQSRQTAGARRGKG